MQPSGRICVVWWQQLDSAVNVFWVKITVKKKMSYSVNTNSVHGHHWFGRGLFGRYFVISCSWRMTNGTSQSNRVTFKESGDWSESQCLASKPVFLSTMCSDVSCHQYQEDKREESFLVTGIAFGQVTVTGVVLPAPEMVLQFGASLWITWGQTGGLREMLAAITY